MQVLQQVSSFRELHWCIQWQKRPIFFPLPRFELSTSPNQIAAHLLCQRRLNDRADDIAVDPGGQLLRLVSQGGRALLQRYRGDDDNGSAIFLRSATGDASVPPGGWLAVASAVVDSSGQLIDVEAAPMPPHGRRVECWQQCRPRRNNGNLISVLRQVGQSQFIVDYLTTRLFMNSRVNLSGACWTLLLERGFHIQSFDTMLQDR